MLKKRENLFSFFELNGGSAWRVQKIQNTTEGQVALAAKMFVKTSHGSLGKSTRHTICFLGIKTRKQSPKFFQNGGLTLRGILSPAKDGIGGERKSKNKNPETHRFASRGFFNSR